MKVYLASLFFNPNTRKNMESVLKILRNSGYNVYAPYEFIVDDAWKISNSEWGLKIFEKDVKELDNSDFICVINYGMDSDSGTAWEAGYAYAIGKPVLQICFYNEVNSLMMMNGSSGSVFMSDLLAHQKVNLFDYVGKKINSGQK